jgi:hypothetical protein
MGYNLHVTRRVHWADNDGPEITEDEWRRTVEADPDLAMVGFAEARTPDGHVLRTDDPSIAQMVTHPRLAEHGAWLSLSTGNIVVKNPDDILVAKMCELSGGLEARVQGDEGEFYEIRNGVVEVIA